MSMIRPITPNPYQDSVTNSFNVYINTKLSKEDKLHISVLGCNDMAVILVSVPIGTRHYELQEAMNGPILCGISKEPYFEDINNELRRVDMPTLNESFKDVIIIWEMDKALCMDRSFEVYHAKGDRTFVVSELCEGQDNIRINISELTKVIKLTPYQI